MPAVWIKKRKPRFADELMRWMIYRDILDSKVFIRFLDRLAKDSGRKKILTLDNLHVLHSTPVKEWLAQNAHRSNRNRWQNPP